MVDTMQAVSKSPGNTLKTRERRNRFFFLFGEEKNDRDEIEGETVSRMHLKRTLNADSKTGRNRRTRKCVCVWMRQCICVCVNASVCMCVDERESVSV